MGDYPDEQLHALVGAAATTLEVPADQVLRQLGHGAARGLSEQYPQFFTPHRRSSTSWSPSTT